MTKISVSLLASSAIAVALVCTASLTAYAKDSAGGIETVTVTAEKRTQNVQKVPISMTVVSGRDLDRFQTDGISGLMDSVPNVYVEQTAGDDVIYIRGFGSAPANFSFDQSVSLYEDGIYAGRSKQFEEPFFDVKRVEVLRGPQGALFGKNTPAGAISIITNGPTPNWEASLTSSYNFDMKGNETYGYISGPITSTIGMRLAAKYLDQTGYIHNDHTGKEDPHNREALARLTLNYVPTSNFNITTKLEYSNFDQTGGITVSDPLTQQAPPPTYRYTALSYGGFPESNRNTAMSASATANYSFHGYTLTSISGYSTYHGSNFNSFDQNIPGGGVTQNTIANGFPEHFGQGSEEVRLLSPTGQKLEYVVGAYVDYSTYYVEERLQYAILGGLIAGLQHSSFKQRSSTVSFFGQATYHLANDLRILGSLRYTENSKRATYAAFTDAGVGLQPVTPPGTVFGRLSEGGVDPSVTLQYDANTNVMFYATYGQGSKSGGFVSNTFGTTNATFGFSPEHSTNYEVGFKSTLDGGRALLNVSLYDTMFQDLQVSIFNAAVQNFITGNAASASSKGMEAMAEWAPTDNLDFQGNLAYTDARYDSFPGASCLATEPLSQCNPLNPASVAANNIAGHPLSYSSKWTGTLEGHYTQPVSNDLKLDAYVAGHYRSKYFDSDEQSPIYGLQKGYIKLDARLQLGDVSDVWDVAIVGKNLTDQKTVSFAFDLPFPITNNPRSIKWLEPTRSVAIEATYHF